MTWAEFNGSDYDVRTRLFGSSGNAIGSDFVVTSLTDASQFTPTVAVSDYNVLFAWVDFASRPGDTAAPGVRGRIFAVTDPDLSVTSNGTVNEGTPPGAGGDLVFTISRTATSEAENVNYTLSGTATAGTDYTSPSGIASFAAGQHTVQVHVPIKADSTIEFDETVKITLALNPAASATATINNDDFLSVASNGTVDEGTPPGAGGDLVFTISRTGTSEAENVNYTLSGTATAGTDYTSASGIASFAAGQQTVQVHVPIKADSTIEFDETVKITLALNGVEASAYRHDQQ